jgi:hypothetical protein
MASGNESWSSVALSVNCGFKTPLPVFRVGWEDEQTETKPTPSSERRTQVIHLGILQFTLFYHSVPVEPRKEDV